MLLFVLHLLGDLLEIGSRSCKLRRLSVLQQDFQGPQRGLFLRASSALQTLCIGQVVYSQVLKGAAYMNIANQLEIHAKQELDHALIISRQIDYLGKMPVVTPKPVRISEDPKEMLRFDLDNEGETIRNYRERIKQCEELGEYAMAEQIRQILVDEQDHQIDLATALGEEVPDVSGSGRKTSKK
jgi:bacterioferritin